MSELTIRATAIPGVLLLELPVHADSRGWFKENWQREKMLALGLPDFGPVQNNISFNDAVGTTRGIHAEPWDKYVSVAAGRIFGAWVDLRAGETFGTVVTAELGPGQAIFLPRGIGNSYQTLEPDTVYTYLVNEHWSPEASYTFLNLADESAAIPWPIPLAEAEISQKDLAHPRLAAVTPFAPRRTLVLGADGQLGRALRAVLPDAEFAGRADFDLNDSVAWASRPWSQYDTVINAAAYTNVDGAETAEGRRDAWRVNAAATSQLARTALEHRLRVVHVSSDYVFDGSREIHDESEEPSPLGVYAQTKAAADAIVATIPRHYIVRTSWIVGEGRNFVRTMAELAVRGVDPRVVDDQFGRLSFATDIAAGITHLLDTGAEFGTYNLTSTGAVHSWADIARQVFHLTGHDPARVTGISSLDYFAGRDSIAPRPRHSTLNLDRITATGFAPRDGTEALRDYLAGSTAARPA